MKKSFSRCFISGGNKRDRIIDDATFYQAQDMMSRNKVQKPMNGRFSHLKSQALCADLLYYAHCNKKMGLASGVKKVTRKDGTTKIYNRVRYICINKSRHKMCDGQTGYSALKLDTSLVIMLAGKFQSSQLSNKKKLVYSQLINQLEILKQDISETEYKLKLEEATLADLQNEVINVIRGTSAFGSVILTQLMDKSEALISNHKKNLSRQTIELHNHSISVQMFEANFADLIASFSSFAELSLEKKKQVLHRSITKVYIDKNYNFEIDWMIS